MFQFLVFIQIMVTRHLHVKTLVVTAFSWTRSNIYKNKKKKGRMFGWCKKCNVFLNNSERKLNHWSHNVATWILDIDATSQIWNSIVIDRLINKNHLWKTLRSLHSSQPPKGKQYQPLNFVSHVVGIRNIRSSSRCVVRSHLETKCWIAKNPENLNLRISYRV